jgi:hypothetical protein
MFRTKGIHKKSKLDECKKFDEECKYRAIADRFMKMICISTQIPTDVYNYVRPKPADINPAFILNSKDRKALKNRIDKFKTESEQISKGLKKFRKALLTESWESYK